MSTFSIVAVFREDYNTQKRYICSKKHDDGRKQYQQLESGGDSTGRD